jgi:iron uptake system component EfeO
MNLGETKMKTLFLSISMLATACGLPPEQQALVDVRAYTQKSLDALAAAATTLCDAAPAPTPAGWDVGGFDRGALDTMRATWKLVRTPYENIEGSVAVLFPELDESTDQRYDGFLENRTDDNLFDDQGVTGIHALERILWAAEHPLSVVEFEKTLGAKYKPAAYPQNLGEAQDFKQKLCAKLVSDVNEMRKQYQFVRLDTATAFRGVIGSMAEQFEKVSFAATGEEESRYAQTTLLDIKANLAGAKATYEAFKPWLLSRKGASLDDEIRVGFKALDAAYDSVAGDAIPQPPASWSSVNPSLADQKSPFGILFLTVQEQTDAKKPESLVKHLGEAAELLGIPEIREN